MKAHFHKVPLQLESLFNIRHDTSFGSLWHYHPELELHYLIQGEGVRFIGDNISNFSPGEIILLGENLPHKWYCREQELPAESGDYVDAIVLHFSANFMGEAILSLPEVRLLPLLFEKAKSGMLLAGDAREQVIHLIKSAVKAENLDRLIILLSMLKILSETKEYSQISKVHNFYKSDRFESERLNTVYAYTMANYAKPITLKQIAAITNLTTTSFCRYFKLMTHKTYYELLTEIRINHACRFLIADKLSIEQVADRCGFCNISNFYRQFKKLMLVTPLAYKRAYLTAENATETPRW